MCLEVAQCVLLSVLRAFQMFWEQHPPNPLIFIGLIKRRARFLWADSLFGAFFSSPAAANWRIMLLYAQLKMQHETLYVYYKKVGRTIYKTNVD